MPENMNLKDKIVDQIKTFIRDNGDQLTEVHLTAIEEAELIALTRNDIGGIAAEIFSKGPRAAIDEAGGTIFGKKVIWGSETFEVR